MPSGSLPSWAQTSSSTTLFGGAASKASGRAAADAQLAASSSGSRPAPLTQLQSLPQIHVPASPNPNPSADAPQPTDNEHPYKPKRKQTSITRCPPLMVPASTSRVPYSVPYVDESSARETLSQLIAVQAKRAGFDSTTASALHEVNQLTKKFLTSVFSAATHAAELSCRDQPSARDLIYALETHGQPIRELRDFHHEQLRDGDAEDDSKQASAKARGKAREHAKQPETFVARRGFSKLHRGVDDEQGEESWAKATTSFLPSDSDEGSEMDTWSVSSDSDDEHGNRRAAVQARVNKRKHDLSRAAAKRERRQAKFGQSTSVDQTARFSSSARDLRALTSGEQAWHRIADHIVPRHLPGMPPRHAWVQTPAYPTNAYGSSFGVAGEEAGTVQERRDPLMLVNRKLANARLVEASLRKLIQNTDGAAAVAYASSTKDGASGNPPLLEKEAPTPPPDAPATNSGFIVPKTPASSGSGLTLRLKSKISLPSSSFNSPSQPSTPFRSRRSSTAALGGASSASGVPGTPLGIGMSMGWGGEPLMSPLTPVSATAGGPMTPYPPTPVGVYGHYFGSNPNASSAAGGVGGYRSRSQSIVATGADAYAGATVEDGGDGGADKLGVRVPGPVNYKNVWYAPGSTIASGGLAGGAGSNNKTSGGSGNHPRSVKRMRKWKV
ncbi:uncharacterized protein MEPE_06771 [Melanopsichium pennsylvanicum]|uniref:Transcription initiation factor TFIID subunit 8 n=2 Tax=Melanopsichium pennsylvanicum TaxID=63383 RepID=A0AAJ4XT20_9BASI|nr:putative protein [Melanopsichium pennsylvanicum 4]SNX88060.1 uncharacterized protein MEPE_06771 [Melanopsichium pennsylvanicum]